MIASFGLTVLDPLGVMNAPGGPREMAGPPAPPSPQPAPPEPPPDPPEPPDERAELKADIEQTREELRKNLIALAVRLDVKSRARRELTRMRHRTRQFVARRPAVVAVSTGATLTALVALIALMMKRRRSVR